ncbi:MULTISPECIES: TIGR01777 family oxidoreductase [unclassified Sphingobacterium]|uniref:TIGR01777 family oxidoreductase n=1 Tax=unclassified Sphingobacterium TaxID=2609468 RepID=UPI0025F94110|nr:MULTISPECIES: TIGR01777 family oxidoreductase [unclassified Sphingobacterium]
MKEIVLISGANGLVAKHLTLLLRNKYELRYLTRHKKNSNEYEWDIQQKRIDKQAFEQVDHIIHLAGANIFDKRWTSKQKQNLRSSRIDSAQLIFDTLKERGQKIKTFVSGSASGYYGMITSDHIFKESDAAGHDFLADLTKEWEAKADQFENEGLAERVIKIRTSIVLAKDGGALPLLKRITNLYLNTALGDGKQYFPWIHVDDITGIIAFALDQQHVKGPVNAVASEHVNNRNFTHKLAQHLHKCIILPSVPKFILKAILGEQADMILTGSRLSNDKIRQLGYEFKFPTLDHALEDIL